VNGICCQYDEFERSIIGYQQSLLQQERFCAPNILLMHLADQSREIQDIRQIEWLFACMRIMDPAQV
jgi:hypothetical protein